MDGVVVGEEYKEQLLLAWDKEQDEKIEREQAVRFADIFKKLFKSDFGTGDMYTVCLLPLN
jgi:GTP1/Obg family GTP-binding protein